MPLCHTPNHSRWLPAALCASLLMAGAPPAAAAPTDAPTPEKGRITAEKVAASLGVHGGLCVQIGGRNVDAAVELAATGRYLIHVLDGDAAVVAQIRSRLQADRTYGLLSADRLSDGGRLPYTENLVNLICVAPEEAAKVSLDEVVRVLCPDGVLVIATPRTPVVRLEAAGLADVRAISEGGQWWVAKKPRPVEMDEWSHPRHSAAGNAASRDSMVAPPRRVRWVVAATSEVPGMVTAGGRNFYAGVLARDAYNGLRLWNRDLVGQAGGEAFTMKNLKPGTAAPVAGGKLLFAVRGGKLVALDGADGTVVREYPEAKTPNTVLLDAGTLVAVSGDSVRAIDAQTTALKWAFPASSPRYVVVGDDTVALLQGRADRGEPIEAVVLDVQSGKARWKRADFPWLPKVRRTVYHRGVVAFEVSTLNNDGPGNALHIVSAADGKVRLDYPFLPGMNHVRQARAMFIDDRLWLLHGGRGAGDERFPLEISALDYQTGEVLVTHRAGLTHCFPPVMTSRYMLAGEFDLTDLASGQVDAHQITKAACGRDGGWVPANGLIYVTPKHCVCWPMLRGYTALAPERADGGVADMPIDRMKFPLESGVEPPTDVSTANADDDWPCYRHDAWRSGSTPASAPTTLKTLWAADLGSAPAKGPIAADWRENMFIKGPITPPAVLGDRVVVARPDAHEVVALDAANGSVAWRFTADGRIDTTPTLHAGLCLLGTKNGSVYCLRADDGRMVWRLRAAPLDERIVAYGQLESPWPVPGSVLVVEGVAYFAAGRQSLADGGILLFAVEPATGKTRWVKRLDTVPQKGFYECSGLEFDNFDLLHREGDGVGMSRWVFNRQSGQMSLDRWAAFARLNTGKASAMVPRGCWSYAPRHERRIGSWQRRRPLAVFRDNVLFGSLQGSSTVYRRDFHLEDGESFETKWMTGWAAGGLSGKGKMPWRSHRLAEKAAWRVDAFGSEGDLPDVDALLLADDRLFVAGADGDLRVIATADGKQIARHALPSPAWDGLALAGGRLYYATADGKLLCLGEQ